MASKQYQSEDIELLLMQKEFQDLLPEEKEFILTHLADEAEYTRMRNLLFQFMEIEKHPEDGPDDRVKKSLDALFHNEKKSIGIRKMTWLWISSGIAAVFILGYLYFPKSNELVEPAALADNHTIVKSETSPAAELQKNAVQEAPPKINTIEFTSIEVTEDVISENEENAALADEALSPPDPGPYTDNQRDVKSPAQAESASVGSVDMANLFVEFPPHYPGGESKLIQDVHTILQNHWIRRPETLEKKNNLSAIATTQLFFKFHVNANGKVDDVQLVKSPAMGSDQITSWCTALKNELKTFDLKNKGAAGFFVLPVKIELD